MSKENNPEVTYDTFIDEKLKLKGVIGTSESKYDSVINEKDLSKRGNNTLYTKRSEILKDTWWLDNQFNWTVKISIPEELFNLGLPDLTKCFTGVDDGILPIKSYNLDDSDLTYNTIQMNYGSIRVLASPVTYPGQLTIVLPSVLTEVSKWNSYLDWQDAYIEYAKLRGDKYSMVARDYRQCYYNIEICKIGFKKVSDMNFEEESRSYRKFKALPLLSMTDEGLSTKTAKDITLQFCIVGED